MAAEPTLRHLFGDPPPPEAIDVSSVIRRSRARRTPRVIGAGTLGALAVCAIAYGGFSGLAALNQSTASDAGSGPMAVEGESFSSMEGAEASAKGQDAN